MFGNQMFGNPMMMMQGNPNQVPQPMQKNFGHDNQNLLLDGHDTNSRAANVSISFGQLGTFTYNQPKLLPAPPEQLQPTVQHIPSKETAHVYKLGKNECKEALLKYVDSKCCKSKKPVEEGHMTDVISYNALEYVLETFNEKRSLGSAYQACRPGETISGLGTGQIPDPWSVPCQPSGNYVNEVKKVSLPFTECIQPCHGCNAFGQLRCAGCSGSGRQNCSSCNGQKYTYKTDPSGNRTQSPCGSCGASGVRQCGRCSGDGRTICSICQGVQVVKWFLQVHVQYINHVDKYLKEKTDLPDELISTVKGELLGQNEGKQVAPMSDSDNKEIVDNSVRLLQKANQSYAQEKRVIQRHRLICVTCAECSIEHNGQSFKFWVYGEERHVYCPEYPGGCCCSIL